MVESPYIKARSSFSIGQHCGHGLHHLAKMEDYAAINGFQISQIDTTRELES